MVTPAPSACMFKEPLGSLPSSLKRACSHTDSPLPLHPGESTKSIAALQFTTKPESERQAQARSSSQTSILESTWLDSFSAEIFQIALPSDQGLPTDKGKGAQFVWEGSQA